MQVWNMDPEEIEEEITLPGVGARELPKPASVSEEEDLDDVEETLSERLMGLTEMLPDKVWALLGRSLRTSYWFVRRSGWVLGTSLALLALPPFLEYQRVEFEEMQNMQKKQMLLGPSQPPMSSLAGPR